MLKRLSSWVIAVVMVGAVTLTGAKASAQMVVSDPTNLVENAISAGAEVESVVNQLVEIQNQIKQIEMMQKNLEQLAQGDLADLQENFRRLEELYDQAQHIGTQWGRVGQQFDALYEDYDAEQDDKQTYQEKRARWEEQTEESIRAAMISHGVLEDYGGREADLGELVSASDSAEGTLAAIQAGNKISALLAKQMMELSKLVIADSRARLSYMKQQQMAAKASEERGDNRMMRGYGERENSARPPDELPEIQ